MNFEMNHAPGAGSIAQNIGLQSRALPLSYGCRLTGDDDDNDNDDDINDNTQIGT